MRMAVDDEEYTRQNVTREHNVRQQRPNDEPPFYQRVSIASYASAGIARAEMSVCPSVRHTPVLYQNEES